MSVGVQTFWYAQALLQRAREAGLRARAGQRLLNDWVWACAIQKALGFPCLVLLHRSGEALGLAALGGEHAGCCAVHRHTPWYSANLWRASTALSLDERLDALSLKVLHSPQEAAQALELSAAQQWFGRWQTNKLRARLQHIQGAVDLDMLLCSANGV